MKKINFNKAWLFSREGSSNVAHSVDLPHDAMIYEARSKDAITGSAGGYFPGGKYMYTKKLLAPMEWVDKAVILEFEGVYNNAVISLNGKILSNHPYGYSNFFVSLNEALVLGRENEILVVADNSQCPNSRWYSGSGIYRNVNLFVGSKNYIKPDGLCINADGNLNATINVNVSGGDSIRISLLDGEDIIAQGTAKVWDGVASLSLTAAHATPWEETNPALYNCRAELLMNNEVVDSDEAAFGFRTLEWSTKGLYVNGKEILLRGACIHHDNGILGACSFKTAEERRVKLLKGAGFNAIRSSHNPASKALLDACDKYGMFVIDEFCDSWIIHKTAYGYAGNDFGIWWKRDLEAMLLKNYNHPSVIMNSIGNEISELALSEGQNVCREMVELCHVVDPYRPVTLGVNFMLCAMTSKGNGIYGNKKDRKKKKNDSQAMDNLPTSQIFNLWMNKLGGIMEKMAAKPAADKATKDAFSLLDIGGYNYAASRYEMDGSLYPERIIVGSETLPKSLYNNWKLVKKLTYVLGDFMWTGWDYLGESGIGTTRYKSFKNTGEDAPIISGGCGVIDICGKLRPETQWNKLVWGLTKRPGIGVEPYTHAGEVGSVSMWRDTDAVASWSWPGCEGKKQKVTVYASGAKAELIVNGKSYGKKATKEYRAVFKKVAYEPGQITAISYDDAGIEIGKCTLSSAVGKRSLVLKPHASSIMADGQDLCFVDIELAGENGSVLSACDCPIMLEVTGVGTLQAFGSAKPNMGESFISDTHTTYYGRALAVIKSTEEAGEIKITAYAKGYEPQSLTIHSC